MTTVGGVGTVVKEKKIIRKIMQVPNPGPEGGGVNFPRYPNTRGIYYIQYFQSFSLVVCVFTAAPPEAGSPRSVFRPRGALKKISQKKKLGQIFFFVRTILRAVCRFKF